MQRGFAEGGSMRMRAHCKSVLGAGVRVPPGRSRLASRRARGWRWARHGTHPRQKCVACARGLCDWRRGGGGQKQRGGGWAVARLAVARARWPLASRHYHESTTARARRRARRRHARRRRHVHRSRHDAAQGKCPRQSSSEDLRHTGDTTREVVESSHIARAPHLFEPPFEPPLAYVRPGLGRTWWCPVS